MAAVLVGACASAARQTTPKKPRVATRGASRTVAGTGAMTMAIGLDHLRDSGRYGMLIVGSSDAASAAKKPGISLVYVSGTDVNAKWNFGMPADEALKQGWVLRDAAGALMHNSAYPNNYIGDVGDVAFQQAWIRNVAAILRRTHAKGVFVDDVLRDVAPLADGYPAKYPSQPAWAAAELSFVRAVGPALRRMGFYVLASATGYTRGDNASDDGTTTVQWWQQLGPSVSGLAYEYFQQSPAGTNQRRSAAESWDANWPGWERLVKTAQSMNRAFVGMMYGPAADRLTLMYGKASFLLDWNGKDGAFIYLPTDGADTSSAIWATSIGAPAAPKHAVGVGWFRRYSGGVVAINPSATASQAFSLGGVYVAPDGSRVRSVTLPPTTAVILRAAR
jgi:hypothetical protein